jgi:hypothetical protein
LHGISEREHRYPDEMFISLLMEQAKVEILTGVILVKELSGSKSGGGHCGVNLFALR